MEQGGPWCLLRGGSLDGLAGGRAKSLTLSMLGTLRPSDVSTLGRRWGTFLCAVVESPLSRLKSCLETNAGFHDPDRAGSAVGLHPHSLTWAHTAGLGSGCPVLSPCPGRWLLTAPCPPAFRGPWANSPLDASSRRSQPGAGSHQPLPLTLGSVTSRWQPHSGVLIPQKLASTIHLGIPTYKSRLLNIYQHISRDGVSGRPSGAWAGASAGRSGAPQSDARLEWSCGALGGR